MLSFPNCKINIGLYITERRTDGYHNLETVFFPLQLKDALEIVPAKEETNLHLSGKTVVGNEKENLVWKAYELLQQLHSDKIPAFDIYLLKVIPMGAGLGGGSANGAFMLKAVNKHANLGLSDEELANLALDLGSDCPFFIYNTPQFAKGRGELMEPIELDLSNYSIQLISPELHISTVAAFKAITPKPARFDLRRLPDMQVKDWRGQIMNDFEEPVFRQHPGLKDIKHQLYNNGALYASMTGSGSSIYGIFPKGQMAVVSSELAFEDHYIE
jgi:4-diphosphocytidyl-2-C-methyl-D-erythritol kinase